MALFSKKKDTAGPDTQELLRIIESIRNETEAAEKAHQKLSAAVDGLKERLTEDSLEIYNEYALVKKHLEQMKQKLSLVIYELKLQAASLNYVVRKEELDTLKRRIDLWSPEQMVTRHEFEKMLDDARTKP
ncbi:hypothetical protein HYV81_02970 [Candidatus Woesearchaeota archaeon]|nr:hypothetical protein [Candidatus Woesearchaeota archaeon]